MKTRSSTPQPPRVHTLGNGVRLLLLPQAGLQTVSVSAYLRGGSAHESRQLNGIAHVVEHMAFKGTATRSARQINEQAERLGADVNAHTDKDHTAFHLRGLARDAERFVRWLGDLLLAPSFPADELERERQVLLQELAEEEDDPMAQAFVRFDSACFGRHPVAQPVIGRRRTIETVQREDLLRHVQHFYTGHNLVLAVAGDVDEDALLREAQRSFGALPAGASHAHALTPATHGGGLVSMQRAWASQAHLVLGWGLPAGDSDDLRPTLAAAVLGEGMSSPLMQALREQQGLAYYAACSADRFETHGQFVIEASLGPQQLEQGLQAVAGILADAARALAPQDLQRARNLLRVRQLRLQEQPSRHLEQAALDLLCRGAVRSPAQWERSLRAVQARHLQAWLHHLLQQPLAVSLAGRLPRGVRARACEALQGPLADWPAAVPAFR